IDARRVEALRHSGAGALAARDRARAGRARLDSARRRRSFRRLGAGARNKGVRSRHGIPARHAAARRIHRARIADRRTQLAEARPFCKHMSPRKVNAIFERFKAANPKPTTELEYRTPFELLVAVILSAQATDKSVNLATRKLFADANTPQAILALGVDGLSKY